MPDPAPPRDLILCCDGTGNVWGNRRDTNVVELAKRLVQDERQVLYYDPGVGTVNGFPAVSRLQALWNHLRLLAGLAFGHGVYENIAEAYRFLILNWRAGDRIWLFGFSRGAFTARAVSGMVSIFGVVRPSAESMIPTLLGVYFSEPDEADRRAGRSTDGTPRAIEGPLYIAGAPLSKYEVRVDEGEPRGEVLVLTDVFGATPSNIAQRLADGPQIKVVTGINVPMLWRVLNYAHEPLDALVARAPDHAVAGDQCRQVGPQVAAEHLPAVFALQCLDLDLYAEMRDDQPGLFRAQVAALQLLEGTALATRGTGGALFLDLLDAPALPAVELAFGHGLGLSRSFGRRV